MKRIAALILVLMMSSLAFGCAGMSSTEQRVLSGGAIGAGTGAALGAITGGDPAVGAAIGGAAGAVGGAIVDQHERYREERYPGYHEHRYHDDYYGPRGY